MKPSSDSEQIPPTPGPSLPREEGENRKKLWTVISASSVGTLIEWYDFYIFGSLAVTISTQFFPKDNPTAALLFTLATFATGFIVRPFGALVFGRIGDLVGRKHAFLITLLMMGGATFAVGLVPGYAQIGIAAPLLLLFLRLIQGLALGGEYGGAAIYVAEHAPDGKRGLYTSFIQTTATLGLFVSLLVILSVQLNMSKTDFENFGWRIPFLVSALLVVVSYFIRIKLQESPAFVEMKAQGKGSKNPLRDSFANKANLKLVFIALFGATMGQGVVWYTGQFYALFFLQDKLGVEKVSANQTVAIALLAGTPLFILFGWLSDRIGRKRIMMAGCLMAAIAYIPIYQAITSFAGPVAAGEKLVSPHPNLIAIGILVWIQVVFVTMVYGPIAAFLVDLFPTKIRYTSLSLPYHIGNGVFGGLVPLIGKAMTESTGNLYAGLWYPIAIASITFVVGMALIREKSPILEVV